MPISSEITSTRIGKESKWKRRDLGELFFSSSGGTISGVLQRFSKFFKHAFIWTRMIENLWIFDRRVCLRFTLSEQNRYKSNISSCLLVPYTYWRWSCHSKHLGIQRTCRFVSILSTQCQIWDALVGEKFHKFWTLRPCVVLLWQKLALIEMGNWHDSFCLTSFTFVSCFFFFQGWVLQRRRRRSHPSVEFGPNCEKGPRQEVEVHWKWKNIRQEGILI